MFCPNCGSKIGIEQIYCRSCGLNLDPILRAVAEQNPSEEFAKLQKRKDLFKKLGIFSLSCSTIIALGFFFSKVIYYKIIFFGADALFWSGFIALVVFVLLSAFFFNYPKFFMKSENVIPNFAPDERKEISNPTNKLLEDNFIEPIPSVTERTTDLLSVKRKTTSGELR
ncbi:MAG TPA: hypothetical protein VK892_18250 [Pyrinomonadaceae bacterium]|nr:hypothetical protein [Pyrinomonadaceae bacterium]